MVKRGGNKQPALLGGAWTRLPERRCLSQHEIVQRIKGRRPASSRGGGRENSLERGEGRRGGICV